METLIFFGGFVLGWIAGITTALWIFTITRPE